MVKKMMVLFACSLAITVGALNAIPSYAQEPKSAEVNQIGERVVKTMRSILGDSPEIKKYIDAFNKLQNVAQQFSPEERQALLARLRDHEMTAERAEQVFQDLVKRLEKSLALGDPEGEFVKLLTRAVRAARERAEKARKRNTNSGKTLAEGFEKVAKALEEAKDRAIKARNDALPALEYIETVKADYIDAIALQNFTMMAAIAQEAVEKVERYSREIQESARAMRQALGVEGEVEE